MARFFIDRPVFAIVLAIIITLLGTIAGFSLPIAQYPNITKPRISVNTNYVGASADIVEKAVAQTIEQKVSGVENMLNMSSVSTSSGVQPGEKRRYRFCRGSEPCIPGYQLPAERGFRLRCNHC